MGIPKQRGAGQRGGKSHGPSYYRPMQRAASGGGGGGSKNGCAITALGLAAGFGVALTALGYGIAEAARVL